MSDPILQKTPNGKSVVQFMLIHQRASYDSERDFIKCQAWGREAENICNYLKKGSHLCVTGQVWSKHYENYKRDDVYETYLNVREVSFMPTQIKANMADDFFEEYPEILKLYNTFVKERKHKKKNEEETESC